MVPIPLPLAISVTGGLPTALTVTLRQPVPAGGLLRLRASGVTMLRGLGIAAVRVRQGGEGDAGSVDLPIVHAFSPAEMQRDWMWHVRTLSLAVVRAPSDLRAGAQIAIEPTPDSGAVVTDVTWTLYVGTVTAPEDIEFTAVAEPLRLHFVPGMVDYLEAVLKADGTVMVAQIDRYGNPTEPPADDEITVRMGAEVRSAAAIQCTAATVFSSWEDAAAVRRPGVRAIATDTAGHQARSNAFPVALDGTPITFGDLHWHTDFSPDGQRSLIDALTSARDELGLDFAGPTDHLSPDGTYAHRLPLEQAEICRRFDDPGSFCTLPGVELSGRYGHVNLYAADFDTFLEIVKRFAHELLPAWRERVTGYPLEVLAALCPEGRAMIVPHHTNVDAAVGEGVLRDDGRPFWYAFQWPYVTPLLRQGLRLVEIVQNRGAFETEARDPDWRVRWGGFGGSAQTALLRGHRVGFIGGTDNHLGWPTRLPDAPGYGGLVAVQAPTLAPAALFAALYNRRCYATSGARIVADATLNGAPIGSELRQAPGAPRDFEIRIHGTAPIAAVQVISMGVVLADLPVPDETLDLSLTWSDERPGRPLDDVHYYVRARQTDGHCVWLSPWWVDLPEA